MVVVGGGRGVVSLVDRLLAGWFVVILDIQFPFSLVEDNFQLVVFTLHEKTPLRNIKCVVKECQRPDL